MGGLESGFLDSLKCVNKRNQGTVRETISL